MAPTVHKNQFKEENRDTISMNQGVMYLLVFREGIESISSTELRRIRDWETARIYRMQGQYYQYQQGYLDDRSYQDLIRGVQVFIPIWEKVGADINALDPALLAIAQKQGNKCSKHHQQIRIG